MSLTLDTYRAGIEQIAVERGFELIQKRRILEAATETVNAFFNPQEEKEYSVITYEGLMGGGKTTAAILVAMEVESMGYPVKVYSIPDNRFVDDPQADEANILFSREPGIAIPYQPVRTFQKILDDLNNPIETTVMPALISIHEASFMRDGGNLNDMEDLGKLRDLLEFAKEKGIKILLEGLGAWFTGYEVPNMKKLVSLSDKVYAMEAYCITDPKLPAGITYRGVRARLNGKLEIHKTDIKTSAYYNNLLKTNPEKLIGHFSAIHRLPFVKKLKVTDVDGTEWLLLPSHYQDELQVEGGPEIYMPMSREAYGAVLESVGINYDPPKFNELYPGGKFHTWSDQRLTA